MTEAEDNEAADLLSEWNAIPATRAGCTFAKKGITKLLRHFRATIADLGHERDAAVMREQDQFAKGAALRKAARAVCDHGNHLPSPNIYKEGMAVVPAKDMDALKEALDPALLPAPGVAQEPFEEWHRRECPMLQMTDTPREYCLRDDDDLPWRGSKWNGLDPRFEGKTCREVYAQEHPPSTPSWAPGRLS